MFLRNAHRLLFLFFFLFCLVTVGAAQVKLSAVPSKTVVQPYETFQVQFFAEGASSADEFVAPSFRNFEKIGEPILSTGWTWVNGSLTEYISYTYVLRSRIKGKLSIASAVMKLKGKILTSQPVNIQITDAAPINSDLNSSLQEEKPDYYLAPGEDAIEKIKKNLFVKAFVDKQTCYVGEALLASFKLYTRLESESKILKRPSFNGFSVIDLEEPEAGLFTKEMLNGRMYNCYLIRKVLLFPLQSGELSIEPVEINNLVHLIKVGNGKNWVDELVEKMKDSDVNSDHIIKQQVITQTPELKIKVIELPKNQPDNFNGAVGKFSFSAELAKKEFSANENGVLRITIECSGNINVLTAPVIIWPNSIEAFDGKATEEMNKTITPVTGIKVFEIPFTAAPGTYKLPAISFSYFDIGSKNYKTIQTDSLQFTVNEAPLLKQKTPENPSVKTKEVSVPFYIYAGIGVILFLLVALVSMYLKSRRVVTAKQEIAIVPIKQKPFTEFLEPALYVKESIHYKQFYTLLLDGVQDFLVDRLQMSYQKINSSALSSALKQKGWLPEADQWNIIVAKCEGALFSPIEVSESKDELLQDAEEFMQRIDNRFS